jgi:3-oxoadipate CoA-transferase beta subunit
VVVVMEHTAKDEAKLLNKCTLPLTGAGVVGRVYADIGIFDVRDGAFVPLALVDGLPPSELHRWIDAPVRIVDAPRVLHPNS